MYTQTRGGTRGGAAEFKWSDVGADKDREHYLGHSINAPTGRWQKNKDVHWYNRDQKQSEDERREEIRKIKEAEEDALAAALGFAPTVRDGEASGSNAQPITKSAERLEEEAKQKEIAKEEKRRRKEEKRLRKEEKRQGRGHGHLFRGHTPFEELAPTVTRVLLGPLGAPRQVDLGRVPLLISEKTIEEEVGARMVVEVATGTEIETATAAKTTTILDVTETRHHMYSLVT